VDFVHLLAETDADLDGIGAFLDLAERFAWQHYRVDPRF